MRNRVMLAAALALLLVACSEHTAPATGGNSVSVQDNAFAPTSLTVATGTTVTWTWTGANPHNVTFTGGPASATQTSGTYQRQFAAAGTFPYQCTVHGSAMSGTVVVQ